MLKFESPFDINFPFSKHLVKYLMQANTLLSAIMVQLSPKPYRHPLNMDAYCYEQ